MVTKRDLFEGLKFIYKNERYVIGKLKDEEYPLISLKTKEVYSHTIRATLLFLNEPNTKILNPKPKSYSIW